MKKRNVNDSQTVPRKKKQNIPSASKKGNEGVSSGNEEVESPPSPLPEPQKTPLPLKKNQKRNESEETFLERQLSLVKSLKNEVGGRVHSVIFNYSDGPKFLPVSKEYEILIRTCLEPSRCLFGDTGSYSNIKDSLKDLLYFHYDENEPFFKRMSVLDPVGEGDCGFIILQLFGMYLEQDDKSMRKDRQLHRAILETKTMKKLLCDEMKKYIDYFTKNEIMMSLQRAPGGSDDHFREALKDETMLMEHQRQFHQGSTDSLFAIADGEKMDNQHLVVFAKATNTRVVLLHYWRQEAAFTCCDIDYRQRDKDPVFKFSEGLPHFEEDYDFYRTLVIMNSIVVDVLDSNRGKGKKKVMKNYESTHYSMWVPPVYRPGKEFANVYETVNVNTVSRKKKNTKKVASPFKNANSDVASPLVDESIQNLNQEVERATTDSAHMNLDTIVVNSSHVTDENVANVPNESLYEIDSIFGNNNVEGCNRDQHDLSGFAMAGIAPGNVGNDADATKVNIGDDAKVPYVDQNDDDVADSSKAEDMHQDTNCHTEEGSTTWHLLKWLNENDNYKMFVNSKGKGKTAFYEKILARINVARINEDGNDHPQTTLTAQSITHKLSYLLRTMKTNYTRLEDERRGFLRGKRAPQKFKYYDDLYSVMEEDLKKDYELTMNGRQPIDTKKQAASAQATHNNERIVAQQTAHDKVMASLDREEKAAMVKLAKTKIKFANMKMFRELRKELTLQEIAEKFAEFIPLFPSNELTEKMKEDYNKWAMENDSELMK